MVALLLLLILLALEVALNVDVVIQLLHENWQACKFRDKCPAEYIFIYLCGMCRREIDTTSQYKIDANYPVLSGGKLFRFDWFVLFLQFLVLGIVSLGTASSLLRQVRPSDDLMLHLHRDTTGMNGTQ